MAAVKSFELKEFELKTLDKMPGINAYAAVLREVPRECHAMELLQVYISFEDFLKKRSWL